MTPTLQFDSARYHRNGVGGASYFHVGFWQKEGRKWREMTAVVFDAEGCIAVMGTTGQSYRYEDYEAELRAFIASDVCQAMCWPPVAVNEA